MAVAAAVLAALCISLIIFHLHNLVALTRLRLRFNLRLRRPTNLSRSIHRKAETLAILQERRQRHVVELAVLIDKTGERQIIDTLSQHASRSDNSRIHSLEVSVLQRTLQRLRHIPTRKLRTHRKHPLICHRARPANNFTRRGEGDQPRETSCTIALVLRFHRPYPVWVGFECCLECVDCVFEAFDEFVCAWWHQLGDGTLGVDDLVAVCSVDVHWNVDREAADWECLVVNFCGER